MNIADWMLYDYWTPEEAALLLSGINPTGCQADLSRKEEDIFIGPVVCFDGTIFEPFQLPIPAVINEDTIRYVESVRAGNEPVIEKRRSLSANVIRVLQMIEHSQWLPKASPRIVIEWAVSKGLDIPQELSGGVEWRSSSGKRHEAPEMRRKRLSERIHEERAKGTKAYLKVVAQAEGISISRLKQLTSKTTGAVSKWSDLATSPRQSVSKKSKS